MQVKTWVLARTTRSLLSDGVVSFTRKRNDRCFINVLPAAAEVSVAATEA